jgi:hypothetical protein
MQSTSKFQCPSQKQKNSYGNTKVSEKQKQSWGKSNAGGITVLTSNYTTEPVTKTAWHWYKNRLEEQWNTIEDPKIKPAITIWFLTKEPKTYTGEKTASSTKGAGKTGYPHIEDWNQTCLSPCTKINSKQIKRSEYKTWNFETTTENTWEYRCRRLSSE